MPNKRAKQWAYFLKRLGFLDTKSSIMTYVESTSDIEIWNTVIEANPIALEACYASKIKSPEDIDRIFEEISYAEMRRSFPSGSHGKNIIGPRIVPMKVPQMMHLEVLMPEFYNFKSPDLSSDSAAYRNPNKKDRNNKPTNLFKDIVGKQINHVSFGKGTIVELKQHNIMVVQFENDVVKELSYDICTTNGLVAFL